MCIASTLILSRLVWLLGITTIGIHGVRGLRVWCGVATGFGKNEMRMSEVGMAIIYSSKQVPASKSVLPERRWISTSKLGKMTGNACCLENRILGFCNEDST